MAQSSGDKLYNQGLTLQKTLTVKSQKDAINKFTSAKKLYDSKAKKDQCDQAIQVSKNIIAELSKGTGRGSRTRTNTVEQKKEAVINIAPSQFAIDCHAKTLTVTVATVNVEEWSAMPVSNADGTSFLTVKKGDDLITIECDINPTTAVREQSVVIQGNDVTQTVKITQAGQPVELTANTALLEFGKNGGKKTLEIYTNSTTAYDDNNGFNWRIESKPDWIDVVVDTSVKKKKSGIIGKLKEKKDEILNGKEQNADSEETIKLIVNAEKIDKSSVEYKTGRKGELKIVSDNQSLTILLVQK